MPQDRRRGTPVGRPTKFTPARRKAFISAIRKCPSRSVARLAAGWSESAMYEYLARGEDARSYADEGEPLTPEQRTYAEFLEQVEKAEYDWITERVDEVERAAPENWQAAMTLLERVVPAFRRQYGVSGSDDGEPIRVEVTANVILRQLQELNAAQPVDVDRPALRAVEALPPSNGWRRAQDDE
jgi:hypothetical protein